MVFRRALSLFLSAVLFGAAGCASGDSISSLTSAPSPSAPATDKKIVYNVMMDQVLNSTTAYNQDVWRLIASLQGLINRNFAQGQPALYIDFDPYDFSWLNYMKEPGKMLADYTVVNLINLPQVLDTFSDVLQTHGLVLWDPAVNATANVAATICGVEGWLPVRNDEAPESLCGILTARGIPVKCSLVGKFTGAGHIPETDRESTGSAKCDAYLWAMDHYLERTNPDFLAYMPDGASANPDDDLAKSDDVRDKGQHSCLPNHDYLIAKSAFFVDLSPVEDEIPSDDPAQPLGTDTKTLRTLLEAMYHHNGGGIIYDVGFIPWWLKYTNHNSDSQYNPNEVETKLCNLFASYNIVLEADAANPCWMTNASLYNKYPQRSSYPNNKPAEIEKYDPDTVYLLLYVGDYDSSAWLKDKIYSLWDTDRHGERPIMWNFDPNLVERSAPIFDYIYENASPNDYFATGNSGCGNMSPRRLFQGEYGRTLPDGGEAWYRFCKPYYDLFNLDITGFLINGADPLEERVMDIYQRLSPAGVLHNDLQYDRFVLYKGTPFIHLMNGNGLEINLPLEQRAEAVTNYLFPEMVDQGRNFAAFRTIVYTLEELYTLQDAVVERCQELDSTKTYKWVDPYTFFAMAKASGTGRVME